MQCLFIRVLLTLLTLTYAGLLCVVISSLQCFEKRKRGNTRYYTLVETKPEVRPFLDWIKYGVFDGVQNEYMKTVVIEVFDGDPRKSNEKISRQAKEAEVLDRSELLEYFLFGIEYGQDGAQLQRGHGAKGATACPSRCKDILDMSFQRLSSLLERTQSLQWLPKNKIVSIRVRIYLFLTNSLHANPLTPRSPPQLTYNAHTPAEYQPPLFSKTPEEGSDWFEEDELYTPADYELPMLPMFTTVEGGSWFHEPLLSAWAGVVTTPFHELSMEISAPTTPGSALSTYVAKVLGKAAEPIDVDKA